MRAFALSMILPALLSACSSDADNGPSCPIVGTYTVTAKKESGTCDQVYADVIASAGNTSVTYTISATTDQAVFGLNYTGLTGTCPLQKTAACKLEGACELTVAGGKGTLQVAYTFSASGFSGVETTSLPALTDTQGKQRASCIETDQTTGTKR